MPRIVLPLMCVVAACIAATAATARSETIIVAKTGLTAPLATGIGDPVFQSSQATTAYAMAHAAGATYARIFVHWSAIAPATHPVSGFDPTDPTSPYYRWSAMDQGVAAANASGITPILNIMSVPSWAYHVQPAGIWKGGQPDLTELAAFATALATRYDGSGPAPAAHVFSVWNEANFSSNLYPQAPIYYRSMVNAVADAVRRVDPTSVVVAGELGPVKSAPSTTDPNQKIAPLTFMRSMLCISNTTPARRTCATPTRFDVWAHHPYSDTGPFGHAKAAGGVELGDLPEMAALLRTAWNLGAIDAASPPQLWVTEVGWNSKPPNKNGVPMGLLTRWTAETMYQMWKSGVTVGTWFLLQDQTSTTRFQSGLYFHSTTTLDHAVAKPLRTPFAFPFVAYYKSGGKVLVWGRDTTSDTQDVAIQERIPGKTWKTVATITSNAYGIFTATLNLHAHTTWSIRAIAPGPRASASFSLTVPSNENMNVGPFPAGNGRA